MSSKEILERIQTISAICVVIIGLIIVLAIDAPKPIPQYLMVPLYTAAIVFFGASALKSGLYESETRFLGLPIWVAYGAAIVLCALGIVLTFII